MSDCKYCEGDCGDVLWRNERCRILLAPEPLFPGFCRVVWNKHETEVTDLSVSDRMYLMSLVFVVEEGLRKLLSPKKVNLASLGTIVPHVHWHVIPRFTDDPNYPEPVWSPQQHDVPPRPLPANFVEDMKKYLAQHLQK